MRQVMVQDVVAEDPWASSANPSSAGRASSGAEFSLGPERPCRRGQPQSHKSVVSGFQIEKK